MPAVQTTYAVTHAAWTVGQVANMEPCNIITLVAQSGPIAFGLAVMQGTADNTCKPSAASSIFRGLSVLDPTMVPSNTDSFAAGDNVPVMNRGVIAVAVTTAVAVGDAAYYIPATGVITNVSTSNTAIPNAVFDSSTAGAGNALLRIKA